MQEQFDFIAIGDVVNDEFIELHQDNAKSVPDPKTGRDQLVIKFLGDKVEYKDFVVIPAVGNSPNAAVSAHRLGLKSALVTDLGEDEEGDQIIAQLEKEGLDTRFVERHKDKLSNHHYVLRLGAERTILIKHEEYPYVLPELGEPKWIYFSSVGEHNSLQYHKDIARYTEAHPGTQLAFQPGSFQIKLGFETLKEVYQSASLFFCNKEEAQSILNTDEADIKEILKQMHALGPKMVIVTDGPNGAYSFDGKESWHMPMYPDPAPPVDRTGAGDSFSSTFTSLIAEGLSTPEALKRAPINSMSVVQYIGAQRGLLSREEIEEHLEKAPAGYEPEQVL